MKLIKRILSIITTWIIWLWLVSAIDFPYSGGNGSPSDVNLDFHTMIKNNIQETDNWLNRLLDLFMPDNTIYDEWNWPSIIFYLKFIVNLLLSFVSLIALILTIFAFYMIFFKKDEAGITTAKQMLKWIAIALVVIWLSWIIVSFLYRFEKENTDNLWYQPNNTEIMTSLT